MVSVLRGVELEVTKEEVEKVAKDSHIKAEGKTRYMVVVGGMRIPAKRLLFEILKRKGIDLTLQDFTTKDAVYLFRRLGFEVVDKEEEEKKSLLDFAGAIALGGNAVEDKRKIYSD